MHSSPARSRSAGGLLPPGSPTEAVLARIARVWSRPCPRCNKWCTTHPPYMLRALTRMRGRPLLSCKSPQQQMAPVTFSIRQGSTSKSVRRVSVTVSFRAMPGQRFMMAGNKLSQVCLLYPFPRSRCMLRTSEDDVQSGGSDDASVISKARNQVRLAGRVMLHPESIQHHPAPLPDNASERCALACSFDARTAWYLEDRRFRSILFLGSLLGGAFDGIFCSDR